MIILTSNGLSSAVLIEKTKEILNGAKKAVIITTASEYKANDRHIPGLKAELEQLNLSVELFDFDIDNIENLLLYDVIMINGGNPFYLLKAMRKSKCENVIKEISAQKILIGISADSVVLQKNIELINRYSPEINNVGLTDLTGFSLTDIELLPHYSRFINKYENF